MMGFALRYPKPIRGVPPGMEPTSFGTLDCLDWFGLEALDVLGSIGVLKGCEMPGVFTGLVAGLVPTL